MKRKEEAWAASTYFEAISSLPRVKADNRGYSYLTLNASTDKYLKKALFDWPGPCIDQFQPIPDI